MNSAPHSLAFALCALLFAPHQARAQISNVTATTTPTSATVSWTNKTPGTSYFTIPRREVPGGSFCCPIQPNPPASATSATHSGLAAGKSYEILIQARDSGGKQLFAASITVAIPTRPPPAIQSGAALRIAAYKELSWLDNSSGQDAEDGFHIDKWENGLPQPQISVPPNTVTYRDHALRSGRVYCWEVSSWNRFGDSSPSNRECSATP